LKANQIPEVVLFREVTGRWPNRANFQDVVAAVGLVADRLGQDVKVENLQPYYSAWTAMGFKPTNLAWLTDWAVSGVIPLPRAKNGAMAEPAAFTAIRAWAHTKGVVIDGN
jgi:hypothetical protein